MAALGELLSGTSRQSLLSVIQRGDVIRMELTPEEGVKPKSEGDESRNKYFIVLGKTADGRLIGFVLINTNINQNLSLPLKNLHYPLSAARYPFLGKTRYVDCAQLKEIALDKFSDRYRCQSFGKIDDEDLLHISEAVKSSPLETKKHLRRFGLSDV